ncbi:LLM class flavin-dependent oxidoreductase [Nocardia asteroides]|uniref:LLM class flavin-dependent oxidoreductase n=1 Tax=Nocardia asteroides TaxID=1824 RepID=UPI001E432410|nr:LLM class flavin-dependent oxidoreductase [Nocardia asteroides]UGT60683.1 LLM class flavin-dependent oxidoreductase [Nocardia asteroides]
MPNRHSTSVPLSILDLAPISAGSTAAQALRDTIDLARQAERWGYHRYWLAEHHFVRVASSSSVTLLGLVAAATERIRVGTGAVQVGHHTSASVVEAFGTIDALYPDRLDLGIGRSGHRKAQFGSEAGKPSKPSKPPVPRGTEVRDGIVVPPPFDPGRITDRSRFVAALQALQLPGAQPLDFPEQVEQLRGLLEGSFVTGDGVELHAVPGEGARVQLWIFGSSAGESAELAGRLGLPFAAAYHVAPGTALDAIAAYRAAFRPSAVLAEPYAVISADVLVAPDAETAEYRARGYGHWVHSIRTGAGAADYLAPDSVPELTEEQERLVEDRLATRFVGTPDDVAARLAALRRVSDADEVLATTIAFDHRHRLESHRLLAEAWAARGEQIGTRHSGAA